MGDGMRIIGLEAENFKRLKAVSLRLDGGNLILGGDNESGKSSVLDAIWVALGGPDVAKDLKITRPIRDGAEWAKVTLDLGCLVVTRNWTANDRQYLKVSTKDGADYKSPQAILDRLIGQVFDPYDFSRLKPAEQREMLLSIVDIGIDLEEWEKKRAEVYQERAILNRDVKRLQGTLATVPEFPDAPDEAVDSAAILEEMKAAQKVKAENDATRRELMSMQDRDRWSLCQLGEAEGHIADLKRQVDKWQSKKQSHEEEIRNNAGQLDATKSVVASLIDPDLSAFRTRLSEVESINARVRGKNDRATVSAELDSTEAASEQLTATLTAMDAEKVKAIKSAMFPVAGLSFDDGGVTFNGIPFGQCSSEERIRVGMAIAMAMSPGLRVIRIGEGSLLDAKNFALIQEIAAAGGFQLLVERVGDPGEIGVIIEDGEVKEVRECLTSNT